jgi:hypothetical protein
MRRGELPAQPEVGFTKTRLISHIRHASDFGRMLQLVAQDLELAVGRQARADLGVKEPRCAARTDERRPSLTDGGIQADLDEDDQVGTLQPGD